MCSLRKIVELHLCQFATEKMGMEVFVEELYISLAIVLLATFMFFLLSKDLPLFDPYYCSLGLTSAFPPYIINMNVSTTSVSRAIFGRKKTDIILLVSLSGPGKITLFYKIIVTSLYPWKSLIF